MTDYFLFYKRRNIAWAMVNYSCIILPNGIVYSYNNPPYDEDILGFSKEEIPSTIPAELLKSAIELGKKIETNQVYEINIDEFKFTPLIKDESSTIFDGGYELYALFKYDINNDTFEYIPLEILKSNYFRNFENNKYAAIIDIIKSHKNSLAHEIEPFRPSNLWDESSIDNDDFLGLK